VSPSETMVPAVNAAPLIRAPAMNAINARTPHAPLGFFGAGFALTRAADPDAVGGVEGAANPRAAPTDGATEFIGGRSLTGGVGSGGGRTPVRFPTGREGERGAVGTLRPNGGPVGGANVGPVERGASVERTGDEGRSVPTGISFGALGASKSHLVSLIVNSQLLDRSTFACWVISASKHTNLKARLKVRYSLLRRFSPLGCVGSQ
jgi:hypothetical protein